MALTKKDLIETINTEVGLPKEKCSAILESLLETIKDELVQGNVVLISGFGKWSVRTRKAKTGRNLKTLESIPIGARKAVTFRSSAKLRKRLSPEAPKA